MLNLNKNNIIKILNKMKVKIHKSKQQLEKIGEIQIIKI